MRVTAEYLEAEYQRQKAAERRSAPSIINRALSIKQGHYGARWQRWLPAGHGFRFDGQFRILLPLDGYYQATITIERADGQILGVELLRVKPPSFPASQDEVYRWLSELLDDVVERLGFSAMVYLKSTLWC